MIDRSEIEAMANELDVHTSHVQRDYIHGWVLAELFRASDLAPLVALKGGNCFRKAYFETARYSRDLDLTTSRGIAEDQLLEELTGIAGRVQERAGVEFDLGRTRVQEKRGADRDKLISEGRLYFRDFYGNESEIVLAVRVDVAQFDRTYLPLQNRRLIHPYSDAEACSATLRCVKLEELLALKMRCLLQRRHIADLYDLAYPILFGGDLEVDRSQILSTFFRVTIFQPSPGVAKALLLDVPLEGLKRFWAKYVASPRTARFSFEQAQRSLVSLVESLIPAAPVRQRSAVFFPSSLRNPIMAAGESLTLLRMEYDGVVRLVEPYSLTYKVRRDGVGREYFYVYDRTGGRSSGPGIKSFVPGNVQSVESTEETFEPRFEVELAKAGGAETAERFQSTRRSRSARPPSGTYRFTVVCPYCAKRFRRKRRGTKLNPHKDRFGNSCYGRIGYYG